MSAKRADAAADIDLINQWSVKELKPEDVYCFTVRLCDNEVDRDQERFTDKCLEQLAPMFLGKTGLIDHRWSAEKQVARLYRVEVVETGEKNQLGEPLKALVGSAYMLANEANRHIMEAIDGGIIKEVSVGCAVSKCTCSICGEKQKLDCRTWHYQCENGHIRGETYDNKFCAGNLEEPTEAYEFSFVAVPAQRAAGVTKGRMDLDKAFQTLAEADLADHAEKVKALIPKLQTALIDDQERAVRAKILADNEKFLKKTVNFKKGTM